MSALYAVDATQTPTRTAKALPLSLIDPGTNDRTEFDPVKLQELADSIAARGLDQPVTVRPKPGGRYQLAAGERRWRAHQLAGLPTILAFVRDLDDAEYADVMLAENTAREDLGPWDEARAYRKRVDDGQTIEHIATVAGRQPDFIRKRLALLNLCPDLSDALQRGVLTVGYAQVIAEAEFGRDPADIRELQMTAFRHYRDHPAPTLNWFRSHVAELEMQAAQMGLFDGDFSGAEFSTLAEFKPPEPPALPGQNDPPAFRGTATERLRAEAGWWREQGELWIRRMGKPQNARLCEAVADQLDRSAEAVRGTDLDAVNDLIGRLAEAGVDWSMLNAAMEA